MKTKRWIGLAVLLVAALSGCGSGGETKEAAGDSMQLPTAYKQNCMSCHGGELQGRVGPNLQQVGSRLTEEEIVKLVTNGKGGMPAYAARLSQEDIGSLAKWLSEQK